MNRSAITGQGKLYLALRRLEHVETLPDEVAKNLAACVQIVVDIYGPRDEQPNTQRVPLVGRLSA